MRVLVCADRIGGLPSAEVGAALGHAFLAVSPSTSVAVVPMGAGGEDLTTALAALGEQAPVISSPAEPGSDGRDGLDGARTTRALGDRLRAALEDSPPRLIVDLTGVGAHDGGAGILAALGAGADVPLDRGSAALSDLGRLDLSVPRALLGATELVAVVATAELGDQLLGLRGLSARRGHATGADPATMLATDAALGRLAHALGVPDGPGLGAAGGAVLALTALGAWTTSGPALCALIAGLERTASLADVVVTGADRLDFAVRGGPVVAEATSVAERTLRPCVAVARAVDISARELRTFGIEVAYALGGGTPMSGDELRERARGVASSWSW